jgi:hypothetical protein
MTCREFKCVAASQILLVLAWVPCSASTEQEPEVRTVSSRADAVSGGDVLVQLNAPNDSKWTAQLDGRDVTPSFHPAQGSGNLLAPLTGLRNGKNTLEIRVDGKVRSRIEILNHPLAGPIFSGPHQQPFVCQTEANGLGPARDADCNAKTIVQYYYKSTEPAPDASKKAILAAMDPTPGTLAPGFKPYDTSGPFPSDVAKTVTSDGQTVNYVVRREIGVINRAVYEIQFLHQPGQPLPTPWSLPLPGWNGRLAYDFGGGCGGVGFHQGKLIYSGNNQQPVLALGYAIATSTFNDFINTCNDRIAAETLSMVKEHFIKLFGVPVHTIGFGPSAAAMQQHLIAQNYPGLLDGIIVKNGFPDMVTASQDCALLDRAFKTSQQSWSEAQKTAVSGFATWRTCKDWDGPDPRSCDASLAKEMIYDRTTNPKGARCDFYDDEINVFGRDPRTGFAWRPLDNVGVQYGLTAFNAGKITAEQFISLNETIGGFDDDLTTIAARMQAAPAALDNAYSQGLVATGGGGLGQIPIIDWRSYLDDLANVHDRFRSFVMRARLIAANGDANNQVILVDPRIDFFNWLGDLDPATSLIARREGELVRGMDRWLDKVAADSTPGTLREKVVRDKPADLADGCWATDEERIVEPATYDGPGRCNQLYPSHADPRIAAGAPLTDDVLKCALKPIEPADYSRPLSADQLQRLRAVFPGGICDYSRPGVGQQITKNTWQKY